METTETTVTFTGELTPDAEGVFDAFLKGNHTHMITVSIESAEFAAKMRRAVQALELWREFLDRAGNRPCIFCDTPDIYDHQPNCIYIRAGELVGYDNDDWRRLREEMRPIVRELVDGLAR